MDSDAKQEPQGRAKGGAVTAAKMTPEQKAERARKGALARWKPKATHKGNFKAEFGIDVDCFVLNDENKTAVIHQRGMGEALGLGEGGSRLPRFVSGKGISHYLGPEIRQKLQNPIVFQGLSAGQGGPSTVYGYDVTLLIDLCKAIVQAEAEGRLMHHQAPIARQAHIILSASAKAGIKGLVYALAGYDATREEVVRAFKLFVQQEAREYEREFPPQLYSEWYRLYQPSIPERGRPWKFKHLTIDQVYHPLAKSNGKILNLARESKSTSAERHAKLHQFLSEIGVKALRTHMGQLLGIARISANAAEYEGYVKKLFGDQPDLPGIDPA